MTYSSLATEVATSSESQAGSPLLTAAVFLALLCFFLFVARHRFIDADEGGILLASRLVLEHKAPYLDFIYNRTPLAPYVYGLWMNLFGISWYSARNFSALLTTIIGLLMYEQVTHETRRWGAGLGAVVLYAFSNLVFAFFPIAKGFSLVALFLFGAYLVIARLTAASPSWLPAVAGCLFALSADTRLHVIALMPLFLWWIFCHSERKDRITRNLWFLGGFVVGIAPCLYFLAASHDKFLFNTFVYNTLTSNGGLTGRWWRKVVLFRGILFSADGPQLSFLTAISLAAILFARMRRSAATLAFLTGFALVVIAWIPRPPFFETLSVCMPFLIVSAVCAASDYIGSLCSTQLKHIAAFACVATLTVFVASSLPGLRRHLVTGDRVSALYGPADASNWTLDAVTAVSRAIDQQVAPHEQVASVWPGYIFSSKADPYPGYEDNFTRAFANKLSPAQRTEYHMITYSEIANEFAAHTPRVAVFAERDRCGDASPVFCARLLRSAGYTADRTVGYTSVFVYRAKQVDVRVVSPQ